MKVRKKESLYLSSLWVVSRTASQFVHCLKWILHEIVFISLSFLRWLLVDVCAPIDCFSLVKCSVYFIYCCRKRYDFRRFRSHRENSEKQKKSFFIWSRSTHSVMFETRVHLCKLTELATVKINQTVKRLLCGNIIFLCFFVFRIHKECTLVMLLIFWPLYKSLF